MADYYDPNAYAEQPEEAGYDTTYDASYDSEQRFYAQTEFMNDPVGAVGHVSDALYEAGEVYVHGAQALYAAATGDDEARDHYIAEQEHDIDQASDALLNAADDLGLPIYNTEPSTGTDDEF
jgi:hypothetical protein